MTREIPLTRGMVALIDDEDYEAVARFKWHAITAKHGLTYYAARTERHGGGRKSTILMHREILGAALGEETDHRDHSGLNNRRGNLRKCSRTENLYNKPKRKDSTSPFKGIQYRAGRKRAWTAMINADGLRRYLGVFERAEDAARAYDTAAIALHGEFASVNFGAPS